MCRRHWDLVPANVKAALAATYEPGQEEGKIRPNRAWLFNVETARNFIRKLEETQIEKKA
jgi:hypothetical protein